MRAKFDDNGNLLIQVIPQDSNYNYLAQRLRAFQRGGESAMLSVDEGGREHKGKGPGGGQFVSKGKGGGGTDKVKETARGKEKTGAEGKGKKSTAKDVRRLIGKSNKISAKNINKFRTKLRSLGKSRDAQQAVATHKDVFRTVGRAVSGLSRKLAVVSSGLLIRAARSISPKLATASKETLKYLLEWGVVRGVVSTKGAVNPLLSRLANLRPGYLLTFGADAIKEVIKIGYRHKMLISALLIAHAIGYPLLLDHLEDIAVSVIEYATPERVQLIKDACVSAVSKLHQKVGTTAGVIGLALVAPKIIGLTLKYTPKIVKFVGKQLIKAVKRVGRGTKGAKFSTDEGQNGIGALFAYDIHNRRAQGILNRSLEAAKKLSAAARKDLESALKDGPDNGVALLDFVDKYRLQLAKLLTASQLASVLEGAREVIAKVPQIEDDAAIIARTGEPSLPTFPVHEGIHLPVIEEAAKQLAEKNVLSRHGYDALEAQARTKAFTVSGVDVSNTLAKIRDVLAENIQRGADHDTFKQKVLAAVDEGTFLSDSHLETLFRANVQSAFSDGQMTSLAHPLVRSKFPYSTYEPIHDNRVRDEHLALDTLGIGGTNIYRNDDPVFRTFRPPWSWNCRCSWSPLTIDQAAEAGIKEAQEWLKTGIEPSPPAYVPMPPFAPPPGFHHAVASAPLSIQMSMQPMATFSTEPVLPIYGMRENEQIVTMKAGPVPSQPPAGWKTTRVGRHVEGKYKGKGKGKSGRRLFKGLRVKKEWAPPGKEVPKPPKDAQPDPPTPLETVVLSTDAEGHEHKGKGEGGGQFTGKGKISDINYSIVSKYVTNPKSLTVEEIKILTRQVMESTTKKQRLQRVSLEDYSHHIGDVVVLSPTSTTSIDLLSGKGAGHIGVKGSDKAVYVVDKPSRGLDVDYTKVESKYFSAAEESETIIAGPYKVSSTSRSEHPGRSGSIGVYGLVEVPTGDLGQT